MSSEPETLEELSERVDKLVAYIDSMDERAARQKEAHELILRALTKEVLEIHPTATVVNSD